MNHSHDEKTHSQQENTTNSVQTNQEEAVASASGRSPARATDFPHSGPGITSFIIAAVAWILGISMFALAMPALVELTEMLNPENPVFTEEQFAIWLEANQSVLGLFIALMAAGGLSFLGLVLGLVGLFQKERKKLFSILGTVFNGLPIAVYFFLFLTGMFIG